MCHYKSLTSCVNVLADNVTYTDVLFRGHCYPSFGFLVTSPQSQSGLPFRDPAATAGHLQQAGQLHLSCLQNFYFVPVFPFSGQINYLPMLHVLPFLTGNWIHLYLLKWQRKVPTGGCQLRATPRQNKVIPKKRTNFRSSF